jgi:hypothetical protein
MNNDPLQRRMFAQQILAQHARANQPMGILASSPQLMGAVQGYANGGAVKGYQAGGASFLDKLISGMGLTKEAKDKNNQTALEQYQKGATDRYKVGAEKAAQFNAMELPGSMYSAKISGILAAHPEVTFDEDKKMFVPKESPSTVETNIGKTKSLDQAVKEKEKTDIEGDPSLLNKLVKDQEKTNVSSDDSFTPSDVTQGSSMAKKINEVNAEGNNIEKKDAPKASEQGPKVFKPTDTDFDADFKRLTKKQKDLETKVNNPQEAPKVFNDWTKRIDKIDEIMKRKGKEITLDDVDKEARKMAGLEDNARYDKDRHTAFWMGLIKGGLATAAGESSNALTNVAKGLAFGVESYGKDINQINENEREDNKTLLNLKYKLMSDKKSAEVAQKTLELQYQSMLMKTEQNQAQYESNMAYQQERDKINDAYKANTFELNLYKTMKDIGLSEKTFELNVEKFNTDVKYKEEAKKQFEKNLNAKISQGLISDEAVKILTMGDKYATFDREAFEQGKGGITLTPLGNKLNDLWLSGKYTGKMTNLMHSVDTAMKNKNYMGVPFETADQAKAATLLWIEGGYAKRFASLKADVQDQIDPKTNENISLKARENQLINEWKVKSLGGTGSTTIKIDKTGKIIKPGDE